MKEYVNNQKKYYNRIIEIVTSALLNDDGTWALAMEYIKESLSNKLFCQKIPFSFFLKSCSLCTEGLDLVVQ